MSIYAVSGFQNGTNAWGLASLNMYDSLVDAQDEAINQAEQDSFGGPFFVHEITTTAVFKATATKTVATEVM